MSQAGPAAAAAVLAVVLAGCNGEDDGGGAPIGVYRQDHAAIDVQRVNAQQVRLDMTLERIDTMPDLVGVDACPTVHDEYTLPAEVLARYDSPGEALEAATITHFVDFKPGSTFDYQLLVDFDGDWACRSAATDSFYASDNELRVASGLTITYHLSPDRGHLAMSMVVAELDTSSPDLSDTDYHWLAGQWVSETNPDETITFGLEPERLEHVLLRQVGNADDPEVPLPTVCRYRLEADAYTIVQAANAPALLEYEPHAYQLLEDPRNGAGCAAFLARLGASVGEQREAWTIEQGADGKLVLDGASRFSRL